MSHSDVSNNPYEDDPFAGEFHLRAARVGLDGSAVAMGKIDIPPDPGGQFRPLAHSSLAFGMAAPGGGHLTAVRARRDANTGLLETEALGPSIYLPPALYALVCRTLHVGKAEPVTATLDDRQGYVMPVPGAEANLRQGLSDWRLETAVREGEAITSLSAALTCTGRPDGWWAKAEPPPQHWPIEGSSAPRLQAAFSVDLVTRAVCFGAYERSLGRMSPLRPFPNPALEPAPSVGGRLEDALFGLVGAVFGRGNRLPWVQIHSFAGGARIAPSMTISTFREIARNEVGFITDTDEVYPRVTLRGINLDTIVDMLMHQPVVSLNLEDGEHGELNDPQKERYEYEGGGRVDRTIKKAHLKFMLDAHGLHGDYKVLSPIWQRGGNGAWLEGEFTLAWPILIVRYPRLARRWRVIWRG